MITKISIPTDIILKELLTNQPTRNSLSFKYFVIKVLLNNPAWTQSLDAARAAANLVNQLHANDKEIAVDNFTYQLLCVAVKDVKYWVQETNGPNGPTVAQFSAPIVIQLLPFVDAVLNAITSKDS